MRELDEKISKELAEKLSKNFSYENLEEFLIRKNPNFIIHRERLYSNEEELNEIFPIEEVYKFAEVNLKDGLHFVVFVIKTNELIKDIPSGIILNDDKDYQYLIITDKYKDKKLSLFFYLK